jgi:hypothetical protein
MISREIVANLSPGRGISRKKMDCFFEGALSLIGSPKGVKRQGFLKSDVTLVVRVRKNAFQFTICLMCLLVKKPFLKSPSPLEIIPCTEGAKWWFEPQSQVICPIERFVGVHVLGIF